jgi:mono/diheme cytochrome c family protein
MRTVRIFSLILGFLLTQSAAWGAENGQRNYERQCARCHGLTGVPVMPETPNLAMRERMNKPDLMLLQYLKMPTANHPSYFGILTDQEILEVIRYLRVMRP